VKNILYAFLLVPLVVVVVVATTDNTQLTADPDPVPETVLQPTWTNGALADCLEYFETNAGWCKVGTDNLANHTLSRDELGEIWGWAGTKSIMGAWNGAAVDVAGMKMYFHGLGHTDYMGAEVYEADLQTGGFKRLTNPPALTHQVFYPPHGKYYAIPDPSKYPAGGHVYDGALFVPATGTILYINSGRTSGYPISSKNQLPNRTLTDYESLGGTFEFNPSETETRNTLAPLTWRKVANEKFGDPRSTLVGDQIILGSSRSLHNAKLTEEGLDIDATASYSNPSAGAGILTTQLGKLISYTVAGYLWEWDGKERNLHIQGAPAGASSLACTDSECVAWSGGEELGIYKDGEWTLKIVENGPTNGAGRVYSKFEYFPQYDIFMGSSTISQGIWAYKYEEGGEIVFARKSAQSFIKSGKQVPADIYSGGVHLMASGVYELKDVALRGGAKGKGKILTNGGPITINDAVLVERYKHSGSAGIRIQSTPDVTIVRADIRHQENGVLSGNDGGIVRIVDSVIEDNYTAGEFGQSHNIYIGMTDEFQLTGSFIGGYRNGGHSVKSRALKNVIVNTDVDQGDSNASRIFDFPRGGEITIENGTFTQSINSDNLDLMAIAVERGRVAESTVTLTNTHWIATREKARFLTTKENVVFIDGGGNTFVGVESPF